MNYGLYLSASGVLTNIYRQDVFTNNLANVETAAFKPDVPAIRQRDPEALEDQHGFELSHELLDKLGGGALAGPQRISFQRGDLIRTERPLDLALEDGHQFLSVRATDPRNGQTQVMITRDGRLERNDQGQLVMMTTGHPVLGSDGQPIEIPDNVKLTITRDGAVMAGIERVAQLDIKQVDNVEALIKQGSGLYAWQGADPRRAVEQAMVRPGYIEASGVDPVLALMDLVAATKAVQANANMIRYHDQLMDRAVNQLGRVA